MAARQVAAFDKEEWLPCNSVFSFIQDKEKLWWLFTGCGVVEMADSEMQRWWSDPNAVIQTRVDDVLDGAEPGEASFNSAAYSTDGRVWFATGHVVQMIDPSRLSQKALPAEHTSSRLSSTEKNFWQARI